MRKMKKILAAACAGAVCAMSVPVGNALVWAEETTDSSGSIRMELSTEYAYPGDELFIDATVDADDDVDPTCYGITCAVQLPEVTAKLITCVDDPDDFVTVGFGTSQINYDGFVDYYGGTSSDEPVVRIGMIQTSARTPTTLFNMDFEIADNDTVLQLAEEYGLVLQEDADNNYYYAFPVQWADRDSTATGYSGTSDDVTLLGDVNLDDSVTLADDVLLAKYAACLCDFNDQQQTNADVYLLDGDVNTVDVSALLKFLVGTTTIGDADGFEQTAVEIPYFAYQDSTGTEGVDIMDEVKLVDGEIRVIVDVETTEETTTTTTTETAEETTTTTSTETTEETTTTTTETTEETTTTTTSTETTEETTTTTTTETTEETTTTTTTETMEETTTTTTTETTEETTTTTTETAEETTTTTTTTTAETTETEEETTTTTTTVAGDCAITLSEPYIGNLYVGNTFKISYATVDEYTGGIAWLSNDASVATVTQDGTVTIVGEGTVTIRVMDDDGNTTSVTFTTFTLSTTEEETTVAAEETTTTEDTTTTTTTTTTEATEEDGATTTTTEPSVATDTTGDGLLPQTGYSNGYKVLCCTALGVLVLGAAFVGISMRKKQ